MKLVIAEKPSVAKSMAAVLGATYPQRRLPGGRRLAGELVPGAPGRLADARHL